jgi:guanylate kinase
LLVIISGPSGVGKDAVLDAMKRKHNGSVHYTVTTTTRPQRPGEVDGVDYTFVPQERFDAMRAASELLECAEVYGCWYGVPKGPVRAALAAGKDVVMKVDVQGARTIKRMAADAVLVFLTSPSVAELERRLRSRKTESPQQLARRLTTAREEMAEVSWFDHVVENETDGVDLTVERVVAIMERERRRSPARRIEL